MRRFLFILSFYLTANICLAQGEANIHSGEFGLSFGVAHYFGDLNPDLKFNRPKQSAAIHYTKQLNEYVGIKITGSYAFIGYADKFSDNPIQRLRNLSFNSDIYEFSVNGTFNFFSFNPMYKETSFTPYVGIGIGMLSYDPYTIYNNSVYYLRVMGTEGQESDLYPDKKRYGNSSICVPFTLGVKYAISTHVNIFSEFRYRFTSTDYLDDVSTIYTPSAFAAGSDALALSDRSTELGFSIGKEGRQRGNSLANDSYATLHIGVSFNFSNYRCPNQNLR